GGPVPGQFTRGDGGDALSAARPQRQAAAEAAGGAQARLAHHLAPVRHGDLEAREEDRAERPDHLPLDGTGTAEETLRGCGAIPFRKVATEPQNSSRASIPEWVAP